MSFLLISPSQECIITSPKNNARFNKPSAIHVATETRDMDDEPVTVKFVLYKAPKVGAPPSEKLQTVTDIKAPSNADFAKVPAGKYVIYAIATVPSDGTEVYSRTDVTVEDYSIRAVSPTLKKKQ